jgi:NNP family nitrate/nitrite transporter-like MFS transporter
MKNKTNSSTPSNYRWKILTLAALTHTFAAAIPTMCMPVLFKEISEDLGLSLVQVGAVWGMSSLTGILTGLIGGALGDRFGVKRTLSIACLLAGITGAMRGLSNDFVTLSGTLLLSGFIIPVIPMNVHKTCGEWFSGKRLGLANGVVSAGMALGFMIGSMISATVLSPLLGGWRNVLFLYGVITMLISIPWVFTRPAPSSQKEPAGESDSVSFKQSVRHLFPIKNIWILGFTALGVGGCIAGLLGYLPLYLREIGWPEANADGALAAFHGISLVFAIPITMLSDRLGSRKMILIPASIMVATGTGLLSLVQGGMIWAAVLIAGVVRDGFMGTFMTTVIETKGVGGKYAGTATGMVMVFLRLGAFLSPPIGNSLASIDLSLPFLFWAILAVLGLVGFYFIRENHSRSV